MLRKVLKFFLLLLILLALAAGIIFLVIYNQWPWWVGIAIGVGLLGIWTILVFVRKFLLRVREKKFVRQIIAQDQAAIEAATPTERRQLLDVQDKWKKSIALLKNSQIKKMGNPLYVLPWYIVLGDSGSGKTSAIQNTKLSSPLTEVSRAAGIAGTRDFDWWFFEDSIILDTAGRYSVPVDGERDVEEWEAFLALLAKYRKKEPLNGVVVTVPADVLLAESGEVLSDQGQHFRRRIDQLMRTCGARFPIYIMVTKTDLVHGMTSFCELLPGQMHQQALGCANEGPVHPWQRFLDAAMETLVHRFKNMRLLLIQKNKDVDPGVFLFPDEFYRLHGGLTAFAKGVFADNPYQETPLFRGIFFSSALQDGSPTSDFLQNFEIPAPKNDIQGSRTKSLFLYDFFKQILPFDRYLFSPILEYIKWRRTTLTLGVAGWLLIFCCLGGLITFSYLCNLTALHHFSREFRALPDLGTSTANNLLFLIQYQMKIEKVCADNRYEWVPRFGLKQSLQAEKYLKSAYASLVLEKFLVPLDRRIQRQISDFRKETPDDLKMAGAGVIEDMKAGYVNHLVSRIRLLEKYLDQGSFSGMRDLAETAAQIFLVMDPDMLWEVAVKFRDIYVSALLWGKEQYLFRSNLQELEISLARILEVSSASGDAGYEQGGCSLHWLANIKIPEVRPLQLEDYWGWPDDRQVFSGSYIVPGAYTRKGKQYLSDFISRIEAVMASRDPRFKAETARFWKWYYQQYFKSWANFAGDFSQGKKVLQDRESWQTMGVAMVTDENPYVNFLSKMAPELDAFAEKPDWAGVVQELNQAMVSDPSENQPDRKPDGFFSGMKKKGSNIYQKTLDKTNPEMALKRRQRLALGKAWHDYRDSFKALLPSLQSRQEAYQMARGFFPFGNNGTESNSPFFISDHQLVVLEQHLEKFGDASVAVALAEGPLAFLLDYVTNESADVLQQKWEAMVLGKIQGVSPTRVPRIVFKKPGGLIWDFLDGPAEPFVGLNQDGYYAQQALGRRLAFNPRLFTFITKGSEALVEIQPSYVVDIQAKPIDFNDGSQVRPFAAFLELQCAEEKISLKNYNYSDFKRFKWVPDTCGDTLLRIFFPDITLVKKYAGPMGFPGFLSDFRDGVKTFKPADFPDNRAYLENQGIEWIELSFGIEGEEPVIDLLRELPEEIPERIVVSSF